MQWHRNIVFIHRVLCSSREVKCCPVLSRPYVRSVAIPSTTITKEVRAVILCAQWLLIMRHCAFMTLSSQKSVYLRKPEMPWQLLWLNLCLFSLPQWWIKINKLLYDILTTYPEKNYQFVQSPFLQIKELKPKVPHPPAVLFVHSTFLSKCHEFSCITLIVSI